MPLHRELHLLSPKTNEKCLNFLTECQVQGLPVLIVETLREGSVQLAYFAQGENRCKLPEINNLRERAGLWKLTEDEATSTVTWTMTQSKHLTGDAFDVVPLDAEGKPWWKAPDSVWEKLACAGERVGLSPGRRWKNKDSPHMENIA